MIRLQCPIYEKWNSCDSYDQKNTAEMRDANSGISNTKPQKDVWEAEAKHKENNKNT